MNDLAAARQLDLVGDNLAVICFRTQPAKTKGRNDSKKK
jgi:hypothetical protein